MPFATAMKQFYIPRNTLNRRILQKNRDATGSIQILEKVFSDQQEMELLKHIFYMERQFYDITLKDLRYLAYSLA